jgi:DNA modification methylase
MRNNKLYSTKFKEDLEVQYVAVGNLIPAEYNPRHWDEQAKSQLKESIERFGLVDPIIANGAPARKNIVLGGHFRLYIAKQLGYETVPVVYINISDLEKEKELNLRLNKNQGTWDFEKLKSFDLDLLLDTGFDDTDLSHIWDDNLEVEDDQFNTEAEVEKAKTTKIKFGDMFQLGSHRLICGDSTDLATVQRLVGNQQIDTIYCDPIYNIGLDYNKGVGNKGKYGGKVNDKQSAEEYEKFLTATLKNALAVAKPDVHSFYWCDEKYIGLVQKVFADSGLNPLRVCYWIKNGFNVTPNVAFNKCLEACVYGTKGKPYLNPNMQNLHELINKEIGTGNQLIDDVMDIFNIWLAKRQAGQDYQHPTQKPVSLHERPLRRCTKPGSNVLDLFGGSGSTLLACEQLKRKAFLVEIEPVFCQVIINRYESYAKQKAKKLN